MPGLSISLNGQHLVTIATEGLNVVSVQVHGDCIGPEFASIEASGGLYGEEKDNKHLIWVNEHQIAQGDEVDVTFLEEAETSHSGKTIEELYPDSDSQMGPWQSLEEIFRDLAQKPKVREQFAFQVVPPSGAVIHSCTEPNDHSFGFSVLWDWMHPDIVRVSLTSNSLEGIEKRQEGFEHARFRLQIGQSVKLRVSAEPVAQVDR